MKQPINLNHDVLNELAQKADELCALFDEECALPHNRQKQVEIPMVLTVFSTSLFVFGSALVAEGITPNGLCWYGSCILPA